jgi:predicted transcriptional regulator
VANGYDCPGYESEIEIVKIVQTSLEVSATKTEGDNCIHRGEVTFQGKIQNDSIVGSMNARNPITLEEIIYPMEMKIINRDSLYLDIEGSTGIGYKRIVE